MTNKIAILDDHSKLGLSIGNRASLKDCEVTVFEDHLYDVDALIQRLSLRRGLRHPRADRLSA